MGDCLISAGFLSYMGPFLSHYREEMLELWISQIDADNIPRTPTYKFADFLSRPTQVREWNIQGLPADSFSTENGVIVNRLLALKEVAAQYTRISRSCNLPSLTDRDQRKTVVVVVVVIVVVVVFAVVFVVVFLHREDRNSRTTTQMT